MNVFVVSRESYKPEGAFESRKLAEHYISERINESADRGHEISELEVVKISDRPDLLVGAGQIVRTVPWSPRGPEGDTERNL